MTYFTNDRSLYHFYRCKMRYHCIVDSVNKTEYGVAVSTRYEPPIPQSHPAVPIMHTAVEPEFLVWLEWRPSPLPSPEAFFSGSFLINRKIENHSEYWA